jgi:hypothetical protein
MHASAIELQLFVTARLDEERTAWLSQHCEVCDACSAAVADEARLEVALRSIAADRRCGTCADAAVSAVEPFATLQPLAPPRPRLYAFAAAAAVVLAFFAAQLPRPQVRERAAVFADAGDLARVQPQSPAWAGGEPSGGTP